MGVRRSGGVYTARPRTVLTILAAVIVAGFGGGDGTEQVFGAADAARIAAVRPVGPGWVWPRIPEQGDALSGEPDSSDPLLTALKEQTAHLVQLGEAGNTWRNEDKLGKLSVSVFGSADDAHEMMAPFNAFSRTAGERSGAVTKDERLDYLGDEAWRLRVGGSGTQVTYHWRRGNLVVEAHVHCFGLCPIDVDAGTRAWADAIDAEATHRS